MSDAAARLYKQLWEGVLCNCQDSKGEKRDLCSTCFGTGFAGGYEDKGPIGILDFEHVTTDLGELDHTCVGLKGHIHWRHHVSPGDLLVDQDGGRWGIVSVEGVHSISASMRHCWGVWARQLQLYEAAWFFINSEPTRKVQRSLENLKEAAAESAGRPSTITREEVEAIIERSGENMKDLRENLDHVFGRPPPNTILRKP
jgi:hypothetical protein